MIHTIYVEEDVAEHPRAEQICSRFPNANRIFIRHYGEIFNRKGQSFRLQKKRPALILARKLGRLVLPVPNGYGVGGRRNYYFSHMLNCVYDCRYCFLQGMYRSAHYVLFVNYEDFEKAIESKLEESHGKETCFFSGYDCDSLALEPVTRFMESIYPFFAKHPNAWLELRTKSTQVKWLLEAAPLPNCVVAFSLTPEATSNALERKVPPLQQRLATMEALQERGWKLGLRFDPMIRTDDFHQQYRHLFAEVFARLRADRLHSVSVGSFRLPHAYFDAMTRLYPEEPLFAGPMEARGRMVSYKRKTEEEMMSFCARELLPYVSKEIFFPAEIGRPD